MAQVVIVDDHDHELGVEEKLRAHEDGGVLHRAFSIFVFNSADQLLLQRRASTKYHFRGLWSNTACGHPEPRSPVNLSAEKRLLFEMGFSTQLHTVARFVYTAFDNETNLTEHELDHVLLGYSDRPPTPNPIEVQDWKWLDLDSLSIDMEARPEKYTPWLPRALREVARAL